MPMLSGLIQPTRRSSDLIGLGVRPLLGSGGCPIFPTTGGLGSTAFVLDDFCRAYLFSSLRPGPECVFASRASGLQAPLPYCPSFWTLVTFAEDHCDGRRKFGLVLANPFN